MSISINIEQIMDRLDEAEARAEAAERERDMLADFLVDIGCPVDYTDYRCRCEDTVRSVCWLEWARQQARGGENE